MRKDCAAKRLEALGVSVHWSMALLTELMERWIPFFVQETVFHTKLRCIR